MPEQIEFIFGMRVTTEDSYFVLDGCLDPSCETSQRLTVGFRKFLALIAPQLPAPAVAELDNYVHITQPDVKNIPNCVVLFASSELHQACDVNNYRMTKIWS